MDSNVGPIVVAVVVGAWAMISLCTWITKTLMPWMYFPPEFKETKNR